MSWKNQQNDIVYWTYLLIVEEEEKWHMLSDLIDQFIIVMNSEAELC